ncbi:general stress protein [Mesobacillus campisalis]|uniref:General stress protein n=1 Tax=Mesobacillus campisalis TaxID=1408103 RepID=A0A0M2SUN9_9BACI|nr:pyridoxamine 5'-phosphate oxidase family protein [Mesobacillus campisalis]KKK36712.1 general stress protein [Mesobacillus campisalis]
MSKYHQEEVEKLRELIKDIDTAMLTTKAPEGLVSRPMKTQDVEFDGDLWFFTKKDTDKYQEFLMDADVNVAYVGDSYVSVSGKAEIVEDLEKKKELWSTAYEKIMQTTYDDPNVILVKVHAEAAEYWETGSITKQAVFMLKRMTGQEADSANINETIELE